MICLFNFECLMLLLRLNILFSFYNRSNQLYLFYFKTEVMKVIDYKLDSGRLNTYLIHFNLLTMQYMNEWTIFIFAWTTIFLYIYTSYMQWFMREYNSRTHTHSNVIYIFATRGSSPIALPLSSIALLKSPCHRERHDNSFLYIISIFRSHCF